MNNDSYINPFKSYISGLIKLKSRSKITSDSKSGNKTASFNNLNSQMKEKTKVFKNSQKQLDTKIMINEQSLKKVPYAFFDNC